MIQHVNTSSKKASDTANASVNHVVKSTTHNGESSGHGNHSALSCLQQYDSRDWIIYSGASDHVCFDKMCFNTLIEVKTIYYCEIT